MKATDLMYFLLSKFNSRIRYANRQNIMSLGFVYFFCLINFFSPINGHNEKVCGKLVFVSIVYRHGDRAPEAPYPLDPFSDPCHWPNGWGQLTRLGKLQMYELGQWIRHRFWDLLPVKYNASDIYVQSTDVDRALVSAQCNLAGLYECWNEQDGDGLPWQPIPVHTIPVTLDPVVAAHKKCPVYEKLFYDIMKMDEVTMFCKKHKEVFKNLSTHSGWNIQNMSDCVPLYSTLYIESVHGLQLPEWTNKFFPEPLKEIVEFAHTLPCYTTPAKRLKCGPLVKHIVQNMREKISGNITQKMWIYSGHDTTLINLMQCLGVYDGSLPPYTATIIFEMYQHVDDHYVKISYRTPTCYKVFSLRQCGCLCPFQEFEKILTPVIPVDWEKECVK